MLEEGAEIPAGLVAVHFADGGVAEGAAGEMEALVLGVEGDDLEQLAAQLRTGRRIAERRRRRKLRRVLSSPTCGRFWKSSRFSGSCLQTAATSRYDGGAGAG